MDVNKHAVSIDIRDLQVSAFLQSEAKGIDCEKAGLMMKKTHSVQNFTNL